MNKESKQLSFFNWSGGKDSALALYKSLNDRNLQVKLLLTSLSQKHKRISMHGVRRELLHKQAKSIDLPLEELFLPENTGIGDYNELMQKSFREFANQGLTTSIYGDIFLEDLKEYRDEELKKQSLQGHYPLWQQNTSEIIEEFLGLGFKAVVVSAKANVLDKSFVGRQLNEDFINDLPADVDPCGENGEFHSFVYDGPIFKKAIPFTIGAKVLKEYKLNKKENDNCYADLEKESNLGYWFCDLEP